MKMLVGYSGFVGSNLCKQENFDFLVNSKNIDSAFGVEPDLLIYSGVPSEMFTANSNPEKDKLITDNAFDSIVRINPKRVVLVSTVAVYDTLVGVDEDHDIDPDRLTPYGKNRYELERRVEDNFDDYLIIRLPAIYGDNLKKNFIFDYISYIPSLLKEDKYLELSAKSELVKKSYINRGDGFYKCIDLDDAYRGLLKEEFKLLGFSALNFTDSRSVFQFLSLKYLNRAITVCLDKKIRKINLVSPPISTQEVFKFLCTGTFVNECAKVPFHYDLRTKFTESGYIMDKQQELADIKAFVESFQK